MIEVAVEVEGGVGVNRMEGEDGDEGVEGNPGRDDRVVHRMTTKAGKVDVRTEEEGQQEEDQTERTKDREYRISGRTYHKWK